MGSDFICLTASHNGLIFFQGSIFSFMARKFLHALTTGFLLLSSTTILKAQTGTLPGLVQNAPEVGAISLTDRIELPRHKDVEPDFFNPQPNYQIRWAVDAPIVAAGTAWTLWAFGRVYDKDSSTLDHILNLRTEDVNGFDRWAAGKNSLEAAKTSDLLFYGAIPVPLILMGLDKTIRKDFLKVGLLYWETMAITGTLYTGATFLVDRYRPETYVFDMAAGERVSGNYKNSFFAGHVANVGAITFFTAKIFHDYHPNSPWRWAFWGGAAAATAATAVLRHEAGKHWPTDLILGTIVGAGAGILVPQLHKKARPDGTGFRIAPYNGPGTGIGFAYGF